MEKEIKFFQFENGEGTEIIIAEFARQAINFYINEYMDDLQLEDITEFGELSITELTGVELTKKREIYNEEIGAVELVSYKDIANDCAVVPCIIVSPNY